MFTLDQANKQRVLADEVLASTDTIAVIAPTLRTLSWLLPDSGFKRRLLNLLGDHIDATAVVAPNLVWRSGPIVVEARARFGGGNVVFGPCRIHLRSGSSVGHWNWISSAVGFTNSEPFGSLRVGNGAALTSRHYLDVTGGVSIGDMTTFAGHRSTVLTHGIDVVTGAQVGQFVEIGRYSIVGSNAMLVPGARISDFCVVGMGSVVTRSGTSEFALWAGNPARRVKELPKDAAYWTRASPSVGVTPEQQ